MNARLRFFWPPFLGALLPVILVAFGWFHRERERQGARTAELLFDSALKMAEEARLSKDPMMLLSHLSFLQRAYPAITSAHLRQDGRWIPVHPHLARAAQGRELALRRAGIELRFDRRRLREGAGSLGRRAAAAATLAAALAALAGLTLAGLVARRLERPMEQSEFEAMRSLFLRSVTHDLRAPINAIESLARLVLRGAGLPGETREHLLRVEANARALQQIITQLLEGARIERGMIDLSPRRVDLDPLVRDAVLLFEPRAREAELRLSYELPGGPVWALADPDRVLQALHNLLSNAIKFTRPGGSVTVHVPAQRADFVEVSVIDTGTGVDPKEAGRLFRPFSRLANASGTPGTGLGLSIVKKIVELHGGCIGLDSSPGKGSRFYFSLPAARAARRA